MTVQSAGLLSLLFNLVTILAPVVGAIVAGAAIRRRGRNARLAMIGCLVMVPGPIVSVVAIEMGLQSLSDSVGSSVAAAALLSALAIPFHVIGLALILAGALAAPAQPSAAPGGPFQAPAAP